MDLSTNILSYEIRTKVEEENEWIGDLEVIEEMVEHRQYDTLHRKFVVPDIKH